MHDDTLRVSPVLARATYDARLSSDHYIHRIILGIFTYKVIISVILTRYINENYKNTYTNLTHKKILTKTSLRGYVLF
jgi:hypothetical protein